MDAVPHLGAFNSSGQFVESTSEGPAAMLPAQNPNAAPVASPEPMATQADAEEPCAEAQDLYEQIQAATKYYETLQNRCNTVQRLREDDKLRTTVCTDCLRPGQEFRMSERPSPSAQHPITPELTRSPAPGTQSRTVSRPETTQPQSLESESRLRPTPSPQPVFISEPGRPPITTPPTAPQTGFLRGLPTPPQVAIVPELPRVPVGVQPALENLPEQFLGRRNPSGRPPGSPELVPPPPPPLIPDVQNAPPPIQFKGTDFIAPGVIPAPNVPPITLPPLTIGGASFSTGINFGNVAVEGGLPISVTIGA